MTSFIEYQFPSGISYGSSGGPVYNTTVNVNKAGFETRQVNWTASRHKYNATYGIRNQTDFDVVLKLFHACQGRAAGFRFKDWSDFKSCDIGGTPAATDMYLGTGNGVTTAAQLIKTYTIQSQSITRNIKKPVAGTVKIALNGVEQTTGWTVDAATGVVTFSTPPGVGVLGTAGYEFDVPVRFDMDEISIELAKPQLWQTQIVLIEDMNV